MKSTTLIHKEQYILYKILIIAPTTSSTKIYIDLSYSILNHVFNVFLYAIVNVT